MKDTVLLLALLLLAARAAKVYSLPYQVDANKTCLDRKKHYLRHDSNLCCSRCPPGKKLITECHGTADSVCEPCPNGQYIEQSNYFSKCFSCLKCQAIKGLQYARNCSSSTNSKCMCLPGRYCIMDFYDPYCSECRKYTLCSPGYGVSQQGTTSSNVKCAPCPDGTFSDISSYTQRCKPHTKCDGRPVVKKGNSAADTLCDAAYATTPQSLQTEAQVLFSAYTTANLSTTIPAHLTAQASARSSVAVPMITHPILALSQGPDTEPAAVITSVIGLIFLFIIIVVVLFRCKVNQKRDPNRNRNAVDKIHLDHSGDTQLTSFTVGLLEPPSVLGTGEPCNGLNHCNNELEPLTRTEDLSSQEDESIGPLQSTVYLCNQPSPLSEPSTLLSNMESSIFPSTPTIISNQPSSQATSPPAPAPNVNVNITFHIGNGSCRKASAVPTDSAPTDMDLLSGEEEECLSVPQQEAGKQTHMAMQEDSVSYTEQLMKSHHV